MPHKSRTEILGNEMGSELHWDLHTRVTFRCLRRQKGGEKLFDGKKLLEPKKRSRKSVKDELSSLVTMVCLQIASRISFVLFFRTQKVLENRILKNSHNGKFCCLIISSLQTLSIRWVNIFVTLYVNRCFSVYIIKTPFFALLHSTTVERAFSICRVSEKQILEFHSEFNLRHSLPFRNSKSLMSNSFAQLLPDLISGRILRLFSFLLMLEAFRRWLEEVCSGAVISPRPVNKSTLKLMQW